MKMENAIAIIGIDCNFPGADSKDKYWDLLKDGKDGTDWILNEDFSEGHHRNGILNGIENFDAEFFKINPNDAKYMDPQQRLFLESAWKVVEDAGYNAEKMNRAVGIFAGGGINSYLMNNVIPHVINNKEDYKRFFSQIIHGNSNDYLTSRVSYQMNYTGPSVTVQTACSSSLTAVHLACRSLLLYECDMAISGGVSVNALQDMGYQYRKGEVRSASGKCAPFSQERDGTVFSSGVGTVLLKRYEEAVEDKDYIYGVIRGSAIGNDGADKISYMAPSMKGQENVIRIAANVADIEAESIDYIETHGTGTEIGDKIELQALKQALPAISHCYIGSVKGNIGHTMAAAGIASLIKTVLCLDKGCLCPSIHCEKEMEELKETAFHVNTELMEWKKEKRPRRAGVSSFGMGGANAHLILEENPQDNPKEYGIDENSNVKFLKLSAKSEESLEKMKTALIEFLKTNKISDEELVYAYENRCEFQKRQLIYFRKREELLQKLEKKEIIEYEIETVKEIYLSEDLRCHKELLYYEKMVNAILEEKSWKSGVQKRLEVKTEDGLAEILKYFWERGEKIVFQYRITRKIPVPAYQFLGKRFWIEDTEEARGAGKCKEEKQSGHIDKKEYVRSKWEKYLGLKNVKDDQNFFEIGGHSLMAIQILNEIEDETGVMIQVEDILEDPTIDNMGRLLSLQNAR